MEEGLQILWQCHIYSCSYFQFYIFIWNIVGRGHFRWETGDDRPHINMMDQNDVRSLGSCLFPRGGRLWSPRYGLNWNLWFTNSLVMVCKFKLDQALSTKWIHWSLNWNRLEQTSSHILISSIFSLHSALWCRIRGYRDNFRFNPEFHS